MKKMNKLLKGLSLGIGVMSLVGLVNVPALADSDTSNTFDYSDKPSYMSKEAWDEVNKAAEEKNKNIHTDILLRDEKEEIPQDGNSKKLNVGWSNTMTGIYYCKDESRVKVTGWQQIDGKWYYFDPSTYDMKTGWFNDGGNWYYLTEPSYLGEGKVKIKDGLGSMQVDWIKINGKWYYFNSDGSMKIGWLNDGGKWYYFLEATHVNKNHLNPEDRLLGAMQTGWLRDNDKIYYFNENGVMQTGWVKNDDNKWYYLYSNGTIATNTTIDGCTLYADGAWCEPQNNETKTISKESDFLFDGKTGTITKYVGTNTTVVIPSTINGVSVTSIGKEAFEKTACTSIVIPNSVTNIEASAFMWCNELTDITIPNSVTSIGDGAFCNCSSLKSITIPDSVTSFGEYVLGNCSSLININAGQKVKDKINSQRVIPY